MFRGPQRRSEELRSLLVIPWTVVAADRVMVGDRPAGSDQRLAGRELDRPPLRRQFTVPPEGVKREIGCRPVGIDMGEPTGHLPRPPSGLADRGFGRGLDRIVKSFEALPGDR